MSMAPLVPAGHPYKYCQISMMLNFDDRMKTTAKFCIEMLTIIPYGTWKRKSPPGFKEKGEECYWIRDALFARNILYDVVGGRSP